MLLTEEFPRLQSKLYFVLPLTISGIDHMRNDWVL